MELMGKSYYFAGEILKSCVNNGFDSSQGFTSASKKLVIGDKILVEKPMFIGPGTNEYFLLTQSNIVSTPGPICLGCYQLMCEQYYSDENLGKFCKNCKWPTHEKCQNEPWHQNYECSVLANANISYASDASTQYYEITILRYILLEYIDPIICERLKPLIELYQEETKNFSNVNIASLVNLIRLKYQLDFSVSVPKIAGFCRLLQVQGIFNVLPEDRNCTCLYEKLSWFGISCVPNTRYALLTQNPNPILSPLTLIVHATTEIDKSIKFTRSLIQDHTGIDSSYTRRKLLYAIYGYACKCLRCKDPTDLKTLVSAFHCQNHDCLEGYLLPKFPTSILTVEVETLKCNHCSNEVKYEAIKESVQFQLSEILKIRFTGKNRNQESLEYEHSRKNLYLPLITGVEKFITCYELLVSKDFHDIWSLKIVYILLCLDAIPKMSLSRKLFTIIRTGKLIFHLFTVVITLESGISPIIVKLVIHGVKILEYLHDTISGLLVGKLKEEMLLRAVIEGLAEYALRVLSVLIKYPNYYDFSEDEYVEYEKMVESLEERIESFRYDGVQQLFENAAER